MRIREIYFNNFRSFRGEHRISFVDPVTDEVRPVTVLGGSNGTGKTTILEMIKALVELNDTKFISEVKKTSLVCLTLELNPQDFSKDGLSTDLKLNEASSEILNIVVGREDLLPQNYDAMWPNMIGDFLAHGQDRTPSAIIARQTYDQFRTTILNMNLGEIKPYGGLLYFPHNRHLSSRKRGAIEPPPKNEEIIYRFSNQDQWKGSLEQLWVWQNYLDLEQGATDRHNIEPFVKLVEDVLGKDRRITIKEGRVTVPAGWGDNGEAPRVHLDQLPSGEQQVLLLFGELARRRRPGVVIAIDEIENSLHPTLQRLVMWNLRKIAREWDAQVIVTTHSAEIINTVRGGAFINLDYPDDQFDLPLPEDDALEAA